MAEVSAKTTKRGAEKRESSTEEVQKVFGRIQEQDQDRLAVQKIRS